MCVCVCVLAYDQTSNSILDRWEKKKDNLITSWLKWHEVQTIHYAYAQDWIKSIVQQQSLVEGFIEYIVC